MLKVICNNDNLHHLGCDVSDAWLTTLTHGALTKWTICLLFPHAMVARVPTLHDNLSELP